MDTIRRMDTNRRLVKQDQVVGTIRPVVEPRTVSAAVPPPPAVRRVEWLDSIRGAAALFVVLHHTWLSVWPSYPRTTGPSWLGWLLYGHLAVAVFIVVSGFSLSLAPVRRGDTSQVGGGALSAGAPGGSSLRIGRR